MGACPQRRGLHQSMIIGFTYKLNLAIGHENVTSPHDSKTFILCRIQYEENAESRVPPFDFNLGLFRLQHFYKIDVALQANSQRVIVPCNFGSLKQGHATKDSLDCVRCNSFRVDEIARLRGVENTVE